jgi:hypothetical protein
MRTREFIDRKRRYMQAGKKSSYRGRKIREPDFRRYTVTLIFLHNTKKSRDSTFKVAGCVGSSGQPSIVESNSPHPTSMSSCQGWDKSIIHTS